MRPVDDETVDATLPHLSLAVAPMVRVQRVTGYAPSDADGLRHQESGFDHYFVKPVSLKSLTELFERIPLPTP